MPRVFIILQSVALTMAAVVYGNPTVVSNRTSSVSATTLDFMKMLRAAGSYNAPQLRRNLQKVIGGETAGKDEFPWFGYTEVTVPRRFRRPLVFPCGGSSFIHSDIAVSGASCVNIFILGLPDADISVKIYLGYDGSTNSYESVYEVSEIYWPQSYSFPENDIAFFKILSSTSVPPVSWNSDPSIPIVGDNGTAIGYGYTTNNGPVSDTLQKVNMSVISNEECREFYNLTIGDWGVCAFSQGKSACSEDGGSPILTPTGELFGLLSFLPTFQCDLGPSGFTRVSTYSDMIASCWGTLERSATDTMALWFLQAALSYFRTLWHLNGRPFVIDCFVSFLTRAFFAVSGNLRILGRPTNPVRRLWRFQ